MHPGARARMRHLDCWRLVVLTGSAPLLLTTSAIDGGIASVHPTTPTDPGPAASRTDCSTANSKSAKEEGEEPVPFYNGVDLSYVPQAEANGFQYRAHKDGPVGDAVEIVASNGANIARLRIWHDPPYPNQTYANVTNVIRMAKRVKAAGMGVHLDFMYSDWWADPGQQWMPRAWSGCKDCDCTEGRGCKCATGRGCKQHMHIEELAALAYNFTRDVVARVTTAIGAPPEVVQVGNEVTNGFMWAPPTVNCSEGGATWRPGPVAECQARCAATNATNYTKSALLRCRYMCGSSEASDCGDEHNASACAVSFVDQKYRCSNWPHFVTLLNSTIQAVRDASRLTKVMVHISDWGKAVWFLQMAHSLSVAPFDLFGVSYYQQWGHSYTSGGPLHTLSCNCTWCLSRVMALYPDLPIVIVETAYPFEQYDNTWNFTEQNADFAFSKQGQAQYLSSLIRLARDTFGAGKTKPTGVYWWCTECADRYWSNFSESYYHSALFDHDGVANPAQRAWGKTPLPPSACVQSLEEACPWVNGRCDNCSACVGVAGGSCTEGTASQWCLAELGGQLKSFGCVT